MTKKGAYNHPNLLAHQQPEKDLPRRPSAVKVADVFIQMHATGSINGIQTLAAGI